MRIGILGSGLMGGKLGTIFARAGHEVVFSYARTERKLKRLAQEAGGKARPGTPREAAQDADAVLLAVHWSRIRDVLKQAGGAGSIYTLIVFRRARRQTIYRAVLEDWLWHAFLPLIAYGSLIAAGVFLPRDPAPALFVVGAVALTLIFIGIHNAWDAVAYLAVQHRSQPPE